MSALTLAQAETIASAALAKGRELGFAPLTVAVLDAGGHIVVVKREDGSGIVRVEIARGKAWGALGMGLGSRNLAGRAAKMPAFFAALSTVSDGRMVPVPGGVLIRDAGAAVIGAVGISGDTSDNDEVCCLAGIEAAGLTADPGAPFA
ncbi:MULTISPECIES: heme-binding protein [Rhodomicrobium]|uniref:GlcG/HbpS family heme-binding protein n=1 Tax=Rhodomicrobium TaxID=1068 RepID=UPI000B4BA7B2|nr:MULTISPECIES: heme-binding protein [Rhodomicrobium]